jgi:hypothetical protein
MFFTTCLMQLQCLTLIKKWQKMSLTTNNQPNDSWH